MVRGEHEEVLDALDSLHAATIVLLVDELMHEVQDKRPRARGLLNIRAKHRNDRIDVLADDLVRREVAADVGMVERPAIRLVRLHHVHLEQQAERARHERRVRETGRVDDPGERTERPEMHDRVRIVDQRHEHMHGRLQQRASCQASDVRVDRSKRQRAPRASMRVSIADDLVDERLDLTG